MSRTELQEWLVELPGFRERLLDVTLDSARSQFRLDHPDVEDAASFDWRYLLFCASVLATSDDQRCQDASLRIAQHCLASAQGEKAKLAAAFVLDQLANQPAIALGQTRDSIPADLFDRIGDQLLFEHWRRRIDLTVESASGETLCLNRFQKAVWDSALQDTWVSISAPTSAGKSFVIKKLIEDLAKSRATGTAVYIVPTRALIQEVETDFIGYFKGHSASSVAVSSMPLVDAVDAARFNVLVLTQERFHLLQSARPELKVDLLVVDEAHKLGDKQRGVLLQQVIDRSVSANPSVRVIFASPHTVNPGIVLEAAPAGATRKELCVDQVTVNQNLLWAKQKPRKPIEWTLSLVADRRAHELGSFALVDKPNPESKRLPFVAHALGEGGGNLLYVNSAADAEKVASQLYELLPSDFLSAESKAQVTPLIDLAKSTIHNGYALAKVLKRGVAFHYGNMPYLMRTEIERLFRDGHVSYLVCTSTLLEGVNLPCRNIFVRGPKTGPGNPMTPSDFWNLAGRAGRWGSEFQGNVICIDVTREDLWPDGPPMAKVATKIVPAVSHVVDDVETFLGWTGGDIPDEVPNEFPQVLNYLVAQTAGDRPIRDLYWLAKLGDDEKAAVESAAQRIAAELATPIEIVRRNPGLDPRMMDRTLGLFSEYADSLSQLLPPDAASDDAVQTFCRVFSIINRGFWPVFGGDKRTWQLALLTTQWLRGHSLARLIIGRINALGRSGREVRLPNEIRQVMSDVENYARFQVPKYLSCYVDLLRHYLSEAGETALLAELGDYGLMLEFGVSESTQVSLISMGLSRTTVVSLFELMPATDWSVDQCQDWLKDQDIETLDVPVLVRREILAKFPELAPAG